MSTLYTALGESEAIERVVRRFYTLMDSDARFSQLRAVHGPSLELAQQKLFEYLSGWTGGPSLYTDKYGHPRLRQRHMPFRITEQHADEWIAAMEEAVSDEQLEPQIHSFLMDRLTQLAHHMVNCDDNP